MTVKLKAGCALALLTFLFVVFLFSWGTCFGQNEPLETKIFFPDRKAAEKTFFEKDFRFYQPDPKNLRTRPPFDAKGLPCAYVALEVVRENSGKSPSWVLLPAGMPATFNSAGMPNMDGRCWNEILEAYPIYEDFVPLSMVGKLYGPSGKDGKNGKDGRNGRPGENISTVAYPDLKPFWTVTSTVLAGVGGYFASGNIFKKTETTTDITIVPGVRFQTGDGTIQQTPDKLVTSERSYKKFNTEAAIAGGLLSAILTLLLNIYVF